MKRKIYGCDGGCIMIGNSSFRVHIPNGIGDGDHFVSVRLRARISLSIGMTA